MFAIGRRSGFTLFEMLVTISILALMATLVAPMAVSDDQLRLTAAARLIASDVEYAQVQSLTRPNDRLMVCFAPEKNVYWLATDDDPETPVLRPDTGELYLVTLGEGRGRSADGASFQIAGMTNNRLRFDERGSLVDFADLPVITLEVGGRTRDLIISAATGSISEN